MLQPDPPPETEPVLIVSDGEQGDKMEKITPPSSEPAHKPAGSVPQPENKTPSAPDADDAIIVADINQ